MEINMREALRRIFLKAKESILGSMVPSTKVNL